MSLVKTKAQTQSRMSEQKRTIERRRNLIILIEKYLLTLGYIDAVTKLEQETSISLQNWDTADNIDLYMILVDYERGYEQMFDKPPKLVKKVDDKSTYDQLRRAALKNKQVNSSIKKQESTGNQPPQTPPVPPSKPNFKKKDSISQGKKDSSREDNIEITGNAVLSTKEIKKQEDDQNDQRFDIRVLKGIPDYSDVPEYRQLASYLQRDILVQNPNVKFTDIIGLDDAKRLIKEAVMLPLKYPDYFTGILQPWRGVLLFGPPGTGKVHLSLQNQTMLAKSVATQCKTTFFNISASSVVSKWRGQSEKLIRVLFELARFYQPSTIFIDQIDSLMSQRSSSGAEHEGSRRMKTQLLIQMDGVVKKKQSVFILAASNIPWDLDMALLRRLEKRILVDLPCEQAREAMVRMHLPGERAQNLDYGMIGKRLKGYSGSDIKLVCKQAAMRPLRRLLSKLQEMEVIQNEKMGNNNNNKYKQKEKAELIQPQPVTMYDIEEALKTTKCSPGLITQKYVQWVNQFGSL